MEKRSIVVKLAAAGVLAALMLTQGCSTLDMGGGIETKGRMTAEVAQEELHVLVDAQPKDKDSSLSAERIQSVVEDALVDSGYRLDRNVPDVLVVLEVESELWDQTGPYYLYKGDCSTEARRSYDKKLLGKQRFSARGERVQDKEDAIVSLAEALADKSSAWVVKTAAPANLGVKASDLVIEHSWYNFFKKQPEYVDEFIAKVEKIDGVISCRLVDEDGDAKQRTFRIVWVADKIPGGLLNRIAGIDDLDIDPAR